MKTTDDSHGNDPGHSCFSKPLMVIGVGNMGSAILSRAFAAGVLNPSRVVLVEPDEDKAAWFISHGFAHEPTIGAGLNVMKRLAARQCEHSIGQNHSTGVVLLAVKPQVFHDVSSELADALDDDWLVLSILAGITTQTIAHALGARVVRLMPNTPAQIGRGITAIAGGPRATQQDMALAGRLFEAVGTVIELEESMIDAFTAVAGSGPAYIFYLAQAMVQAAQSVGFDRTQALNIVRETVVGSALLLDAKPGIDPGELRKRVTSKGGTTAAAIEVMRERGLETILIQAIEAARDRGRQLAEETKD